MKELLLIVVYVPIENAQEVRNAAGTAGAGAIGDYDHCSWSTVGIGRFRPKEGSHPSKGTIDRFEEVSEEKIEMIADKEKLSDILKAIVEAHPYEEPAIQVIPIADYKDFLSN